MIEWKLKDQKGMRKTDICICHSWSVAFGFSFPFALLRDLSPLHCIGTLLTWQDKTSERQSNASHWSLAPQPSWKSGFPVLIWLYIKHFQLSTQKPFVASKRISVRKKCYISLVQFTHITDFPVIWNLFCFEGCVLKVGDYSFCTNKCHGTKG